MADYTYSEGHRSNKSGFWWDKQRRAAAVHECVFDVVRFLDQHQNYKQLDNIRNLRLYDNLPVLGLTPGSFAIPDAKKTGRVTYNIIQSMVDTATSKIGKERPRTATITEGGNYRLQRQAKLREKFIQGVIWGNKGYRSGKMVFRDAAVFGTGALKVFAQEGEVKIERTFIDEILVDDAECMHGTPRQMHQRRYMAREVVAALWPQRRKKIMEAPAPKVEASSSSRSLADYVEIVESWHLRSGKKATDGRHAICLPNVTLVDEQWDKDRFPFSFLWWSSPLLGFLGHGLGHALVGLQVAINRHLRTIEQTLKKLGHPWVFIEDSSNVVQTHITDLVDSIVKYASGTNPPQVVAPSSVPADLVDHLRWLIMSAYEIAGISQLSASASKPAGLNSGKALREHQDIESERFADVQQAYEEFYVDLDELIFDVASDIHETKDGKDLRVQVPGRRFIETIAFRDISIEKNQYTLQVWPTSMLPKTPAGRYQQIQEWIQDGFIGREEGLRLMDMPDLEEANSLYNAAVEDIESLIDDFLYGEPTKEQQARIKGLDGEELEEKIAELIYRPPNPMQNPELGKRRLQAAYLRGTHSDVPQARLNLMVRWIDDVEKLLMQQQAEAEQAAMGAPPPEAMPAEAPPMPMQ